MLREASRQRAIDAAEARLVELAFQLARSLAPAARQCLEAEQQILRARVRRMTAPGPPQSST